MKTNIKWPIFGFIVLAIILLILAGCSTKSGKLDKNGVKNVLRRFISEDVFSTGMTCTLESVGPIILEHENEATVNFVVKCQGRDRGEKQEESGVATFQYKRGETWMLTSVRMNNGNSKGLLGDLEMEVE